MKWNIFVGSMVLGAALSGQSFGGDLLSRLLGGKGCGASSSCCDTSVCDPSCGAELASCDPSCGVEMAGCGSGLLGKRLSGPNCGCEIAAPCAAPTCGVEIAAPCGCGPTCGVEASCCPPRGTPILDGIRKDLAWKRAKLRGLLTAKSNCCDTACDPCGPTCGAELAPCASRGPSCGAEIAACDPCGPASCDSGCGSAKRCGGGLLKKIFANVGKSCCDAGPTACDACPTACSSCGTSAAPTPAPAAAPSAPAPVVDPHAYLNTKRHVIQASSTRIR
jgi:hypothetical protein